MRWLNHSRLKSNDAKTRIRAINALSHHAVIKEIHLFAQALHDEDAGVRTAALNAVGILRETDPAPCIAALLPSLRNSDFTVRRNAADALDLLRWEPHTSEERVLKAIAQENFDSISLSEEAAVDLLLPLLKSGSPAVRLGVTETLERFQTRKENPRFIEPFIDLLTDADLPVRVAALHALTSSTDERRIAPMLKSFKNEVPHIRASAVEAIGKTGKLEYLPVILPLLKDPSYEVRVAAITALDYIKSPDVLDPIISMLKDKDTDVRKKAVESLTQLRDPRSVRELIATLIDRESVVRHAAANALQIINFEWRISEEAQKMVPLLEAGLDNEEYWVREAAAKALARIRNM